MIEYAIKIYFNNERKGKVYLYFSLDFTEFILNFIEFYRVFEWKEKACEKLNYVSVPLLPRSFSHTY